MVEIFIGIECLLHRNLFIFIYIIIIFIYLYIIIIIKLYIIIKISEFNDIFGAHFLVSIYFSYSKYIIL
jgi:hypothetical protein